MSTLETVETEIRRIEQELRSVVDADRQQSLETILHKLRLTRAALEKQSAEPMRHVEPGTPPDPYR